VAPVFVLEKDEKNEEIDGSRRGDKREERGKQWEEVINVKKSHDASC